MHVDRLRTSPLRIVLLLHCLSSLVGCASIGTGLEPPEVSLVDLEPLASGGTFEQRVVLTLRVSNPNDTPLEFDGIDLVLDLNGRRLGRAMGSDRVTIPRLSDALVDLTATTNVFSLFRQAAELPGETELAYSLKGRIFLADSPGWLRFAREGTLLALPETGTR